ncbi:MAG: dephospho-CoA kinase [candidate division Zixibacteria bacterium]|jgi:dephospho-CoA kinase|nr:dephospho-CoA kinase [candidate division Zixibacteria bacterium]
MVIGLTGQIGSGKSTAARILASFGARVIDADLIGREVVEQSAELRRRLARVFGKDVVDSRGRLIRKKLAVRAFATGASRDKLNMIVHPHLLRRLRSRIREEQKRGPVVIDAALLLYWGMDREVDVTLVIHAGLETRLKRLQARGIQPGDAKARQRAQLPYAEFRTRADRVILNNGTPSDLRRKLRRFWQAYVSERV